MANSDESDTMVASASLAVALVALLGTVMQVLQQYYASATGFVNCSESVIGGWHVSKKRVFKWRELRFEVRFEAPVIFVCPASNTNRPVKGRPVWFVDGTDHSQRATRSIVPNRQEEPSTQNATTGLTGLLSFGGGTGPANGHNRAGSTSQSARNAGRAAVATGSEAEAGQAQQQPASTWYFRRRRPNPTPLQDHGYELSRLEEKEIHTANNEKATWVKMLTELQRMENESSEWQSEELEWHRNHGQAQDPKRLPAFHTRTLVVAVQAKPYSWDTMGNFKRPYATTTIAHLVEMTAMLGLHWKEFDRSENKYRAEGNGYMLTGSHVSDLGVLFNFQICGKSRFRENRIVPETMVKEFVFGIVPTIFRSGADERRLQFPAEEPRDLGYLLLGSTNEVAETVASFGCNTRTADMFRDNSKKHGHLFPVAFELVGMLARVLYQPYASFRMLPNPTVYHWDRKFFDLVGLVAEFGRTMPDVVPRVLPGESAVDVSHILDLQEQTRRVRAALKKRQHDRGEVEFTLTLCKDLYDAIAWCDRFLLQRQTKVRVVLREHVQQIMRVVNNEPGQGQEGTTSSPTAVAATAVAAAAAAGAAATAAAPDRRGSINQPELQQTSPVDQLARAPPELRHRVLMDIYFWRVLPRVIEGACEYVENNAGNRAAYSGFTPATSTPASPILDPTTPASAPLPSQPQLPSQPPGPVAPLLSPTNSAPAALLLSPPTSMPPTPAAGDATLSALLQAASGIGSAAGPSRRDRQPARIDTSASLLAEKTDTINIWCTMVFRMLCWLTLHDFHKNDRQVSSKSEVWGNRLPVYIG